MQSFVRTQRARLEPAWKATLTRWQSDTALRVWTPRLVAAVISMLYLVRLSQLIIARHNNYGTFDYDLGMYDQGIWLLSKGRGFMTVRGMHVFGHHANYGYLLFVPVYWLGWGGGNFLDLVNAVGIVGCVIPVYLLGHRHLKSDWGALAMVAAFLGHFGPQWYIQETFHPESLAAPFLLLAVWFALEDRWKGYAFAIGAALIWKEDVALFVLMLGVLLLMWRKRRAGLWTMAAGAGYFLLTTRLLIPWFSPTGAVYEGLFGDLGASTGELVANFLHDPVRFGRALADHGADDVGLELMAPYAYTPLLSPHVLLLGLPQHIVNFLSAQNFTWNPRVHYSTLPFVSITIAMIRSIGTRTRATSRWLMVAAVLICSVALRDRGVAPVWSQKWDDGYWGHIAGPQVPAYRDALARIPDGVTVSAPYNMVPHLAHRPEIYTFPNPWRSNNFGLRGETRSPDRVDYLVMNRALLNDADRVLFEQIVASGDFEEVFAEGPVELYRRKGTNGRR